MQSIWNYFSAPWRAILVWLEGLNALSHLLTSLAGAAIGRGGSPKERAIAHLTAPKGLRQVMSVLRAFWPNIALNKVLVKSYENQGTALVTRRVDVIDVLSRNDDFEVVYESRMRKLTAGANFFLGMQPGWSYTRDTSAMRLAARRTDVADLILPAATERAARVVRVSCGRIDLPRVLTLDVPWTMTDTYFGTGGPSAEKMKDWTTTLFWYLFGDLGADPELDARAMTAAAELRDYLDQAIATRKAAPTGAEDILNRCLALQSAGTPGMDDLGIRNNLLGLLIGAIPTISKASCLALDELLRRPDALAGAQAAARAGDDRKMTRYIWEALRFNPHNPVIYRRATRDTVIARSTLREKTIRRGQIVFAANLSAMFDRQDVPKPGEFRTDRPWETYIHWGYGMHMCFGDAINKAVIPAILKPILAQKNLRRAPGASGRIDTGATPFPQHFVVEFDHN